VRSAGRGGLIAAIVLLALTAPARAAQAPSAGVITKLTPELYREAMACGRAGADCAVTPYQLCPSPDGPFEATLATPFSRVAGGVYESIRNRQRVRSMDRGAATAWGIGIYVNPSARPGVRSVIRRVYLKRDGREVGPLTSTVAPVTTTATDGSARELARGFFAFSPDAFRPGRSVTIVFVGSEGEYECTLDSTRLGRLK
jgi:hypothetical protein